MRSKSKTMPQPHNTLCPFSSLRRPNVHFKLKVPYDEGPNDHHPKASFRLKGCPCFLVLFKGIKGVTNEPHSIQTLHAGKKGRHLNGFFGERVTDIIAITTCVPVVTEQKHVLRTSTHFSLDENLWGQKGPGLRIFESHGRKRVEIINRGRRESEHEFMG